MSLYSINDPKHRLDRAKEARALAEQMDDPEASLVFTHEHGAGLETPVEFRFLTAGKQHRRHFNAKRPP